MAVSTSCLRSRAFPFTSILTSPTTSPFRSSVVAAAFFTTSAAQPSIRLPRPTPSAPLARTKLPSTLIRNASTSTATQSTSAHEILTWDRFFAIRRKRRWLNLGCSVATSAITVGAVAPILAQQDFDTWGAQISGLDPVMVLGIATFAVAAGGWLGGPSIGNLLFSLWASRRGWKRGIAEKEKSFYARIKRYRADASASSPQNPIPDYYGEKIGSVKDYRRWLKDQKAFNLKKNKNMI